MKAKFLKAATVTVAAFMMAACTQKPQPVLTINMENRPDETMTVTWYYVADAEEVQTDTLVMQGNTCIWDRPVERLAGIGIKLASVENTDVEFRILPGEKAKVSINYAADGARFCLKGSPQLKAQSQICNGNYALTRQMMNIRDAYRQLMANGVENVDEQYADSLSEAYDLLWQQAAEPWLGFVDKYPDDPRAACYLITYADETVFLEKYPKLGETVREGELKERLDKTRERNIRRAALKEAEAKLTEGVIVPDFEAVDLNGNPLKLSDFADKYIVLDFWGVWCPWCVKGMPSMKEYHAKCNGKVVFLGIDTRDSKEKVQGFLKKENITWTNVQSDVDGNPDIVLMYGVQGFPTKVLIEPGLKFKARYLGEVPEFYADLDEIIK